MKIAVLGSTGPTGRLLLSQALARGHQVTALARDPHQLSGLATGALRAVRADVTEPDTVLAAVQDADVIVSALGITKKQDPRVLTDAARLLAAAAPRVVWLSSLGMGATQGALGRINGALLKRVLCHAWDAKGVAGEAVRAAGGSVVYAGPLTNRPYHGGARLVPAAGFEPRLIPPAAPRAGVAALMLDESETPCFAATPAIALFDQRR
ncbi:NAD(P)-binding oxidoreductase [Streptomyces sp. AK02-01A]|uniref:NAD(P)-dependent oxidoreductase n=1 Tax=Streptomyces sp. AK02-01A TaxID=3028648 RepID=UPI0029A797CA|nr:NAD(P)-binding oxidoreductase [Streptomyces sp. AK02-01A]MDX3852358.1 SDR family oxidoreductase [Streptomyces sp. AK02-01A]